ncbi:MAG: adenylate kinase [Chloroflexota bacterium]
MLSIPHIELDALFWGPEWTECEPQTFRDRVLRVVDADSWVIDGNYGKVRDLVLARAQVLVWLDYSVSVIFWRLVTRTVVRIAGRTELWSGNRESIGKTLSRDSIILWGLRTYRRHRIQYRALTADMRFAHMQVVHLRTPVAATRWLATVQKDMRGR